MNDEIDQNDVDSLFDGEPEDLAKAIEEAEKEVAQEELTEADKPPSRHSFVPPSDSWQKAIALFDRIILASNHLNKVRAVFFSLEKEPAVVNELAIHLLYPYLISVSESYHAVYYEYFRSYHPKVLEQHPEANLVHLMKEIPGEELAAILILTYVTAQYRKQEKDEQERALLATAIRRHLALGRALAEESSLLPPAFGLLGGGICFCAQRSLIHLDKKAFLSYRRELLREQLYADVEHEVLTFGCSYREVAALFFQAFGLTRSAALGVLGRVPEEESDNAGRQTTALQWYQFFHYLQAIVEGEPENPFPDLVTEAQWLASRDRGREILQGEASESKWIEARKGTVPIATMKHLMINKRRLFSK
ncbi:hypothetical protein MRY87_12665 [bacterium]|nr:hypothetical protein [bacterium]